MHSSGQNYVLILTANKVGTNAVCGEAPVFGGIMLQRTVMIMRSPIVTVLVCSRAYE